MASAIEHKEKSLNREAEGGRGGGGRYMYEEEDKVGPGIKESFYIVCLSVGLFVSWHPASFTLS